jgi:hypothetical protein
MKSIRENVRFLISSDRAAIEDLPDLTQGSRQKVQTEGAEEVPTASESVN